MEQNSVKQARTVSIVLLALAFVQLAASATSPALASIKASYPDVSATMISMLSTLPSFVGIPATLICGSILGRRVKYRTVAIVGLVAAIVGGVAPYFTNSFGMLLFWRGLFGAGHGMLSPLAMPILLGSFQGEAVTKQASLNAIFINAGGVFFQMFGGILCTRINWHATFLIYLFMIPVLVIVAKMMPEPEAVSNVQGRQSASVKDILPGFKWFILYCVHMVFFYVAVTETSSIVMKSGFGTATAAAVVLSLITGSGMLGGWLYKRLTSLGEKTVSIGFVLLALGYTFMFTAGNIVVLSIGASCVGVGFGINSVPAFQVYIGREVPASARSLAASFLAIGGNVGGFISRPIVDGIVKAFGRESGRPSFVVCIVGYLALAVIVFLVGAIRRRNRKA